MDEPGGVTVPLYVFPHLSFEEYLAALYLLQQGDRSVTEAVERAGDPAWWEVSRFYGECLCHDERDAKPYLAKVLLEKLCPARAVAGDADGGRSWPGWEKEVPAEDRDPALRQRITVRLAELLNDAEAFRTDPPVRVEVGRALATLGDPRPGVGLEADGLPDLLWARIPGTAATEASGRFPGFTGLRLGSGAKPDPEARPDETWPAAAPPLVVVDFELAVYPVTVAQFRPFVEQGGYREARFWSRTGWQWRNTLEREAPAFWSNSAWTLPNHPVVGVSWYEAKAYCNWLSTRLPANQTVRLPSEAEWEWAARGPQGRRYPWGEGWAAWRCNNLEAGVDRTTAAGCFPAGKGGWWLAMRPEGKPVHDLAGNIWEWTASRYAEDYRKADRSVEDVDPDDLVVLRGGSWTSIPTWVRNAARGWLNPRDRDFDVGFRLARTLTL